MLHLSIKEDINIKIMEIPAFRHAQLKWKSKKTFEIFKEY